MASATTRYADALDPKYGDPHPVPIVVATEETLKGYGRIVRNFENEEVEITPWPVQGIIASATTRYADALDPKYVDPHPVPIVEATEETLKGYGRIVRDFENEEVEITPWPVQGWRKLCPGTGTLGGIVSGEFLFKWEGDQCSAMIKAVGSEIYTTGRLPGNISPSNRTHVLVREANYHPDGSQIFYPKNKDPFVALLALPTDDVKPEHFVAFYFDGSFGVQIHANIWHQPVYPVTDEAAFLGKQGAVYACVMVDTVEEFGKYLLVPLTEQ